VSRPYGQRRVYPNLKCLNQGEIGAYPNLGEDLVKLIPLKGGLRTRPKGENDDKQGDTILK